MSSKVFQTALEIVKKNFRVSDETFDSIETLEVHVAQKIHEHRFNLAKLLKDHTVLDLATTFDIKQALTAMVFSLHCENLLFVPTPADEWSASVSYHGILWAHSVLMCVMPVIDRYITSKLKKNERLFCVPSVAAQVSAGNIGDPCKHSQAWVMPPNSLFCASISVLYAIHSAIDLARCWIYKTQPVILCYVMSDFQEKLRQDIDWIEHNIDGRPFIYFNTPRSLRAFGDSSTRKHIVHIQMF